MKTNIISGCIAALGLLLGGCTNDPTTTVIVPGDDPIELSGIVTRALGNNAEVPLRLIAISDDGQTYISETEITCPTGLVVDENRPLNFPGGSPYYPLAKNQIHFFAYSGTAPGGLMQLTAGQEERNNALLSNTGWRYGDNLTADPDPTYEGKGTPGSSDVPAQVLQFRHVMTRVNVTVVVNRDESIPVDPEPENVEFTIDGLYRLGTYPITALEPDENDPSSATRATVVGSDLYTLKLGENFLIPNGESLDKKKFTSLKIDRYTATDADLDEFLIELDPSYTNSQLLPGFSYDLIITIQRLRITSVKLSPVPWIPVELDDPGPSFTPYPATLDLGNYVVASETDVVNEVVLHTVDNKLYVGDLSADGTQFDFVTLPTTEVVSMELYTPRGLLLFTNLAGAYNNGVITLPLSEAGMLPETPTSAYDPVSNPYSVTTPVQFLNISKQTDVSYRQATDIDLDALIIADDYVFTGLGDFSGTYDGNGFWLGTVEMVGSGLFNSNSGILRHIRLLSGYVDATSQSFAGSICGTNTPAGTIVACMNENYIKGSSGTVGGIVGLNQGQILACINTGNIQSGNIVGGICGQNDNGAAGALAACINTGTLPPNAGTLAAICGTSIVSGNNILRHCFWLYGTAQHQFGQAETAVTPNTVLYEDCTDMDPAKLRNELDIGEEESDRILNRLDSEIALFPAWYPYYEYVLDFARTGITWPAPVER